MTRKTIERALGRMDPEETASLLEAFQRMGYYNPDPEELMRGLREVSLRKIPKGTVLIRAGEEPREFFILHSGKVEVTRERGGRAARVAVLGRYDVFGEMALVEDRPRSATVTALEDCSLFHLTRRDFDFLMRTCDVFRQVIETLVAERNRYNAQTQGD